MAMQSSLIVFVLNEQQAITFHTRNKNWFILTALIFKSCHKSCTYHNDMKLYNYERRPTANQFQTFPETVSIKKNVVHHNFQPKTTSCFQAKDVCKMHVLQYANNYNFQLT